MSAKDNERIAREFYDAGNKHQLNLARKLLSPDVVTEMVPTNEVSRGVDAFEQMWNAGAEAFPDMTIKVDNLISTDNVVVCEIRCIGTQTGPMQTPQGVIPATNQRTEMRLVDILEIQNGRISHIRTYYDSAPMQQQVRKAA